MAHSIMVHAPYRMHKTHNTMHNAHNTINSAYRDANLLHHYIAFIKFWYAPSFGEQPVALYMPNLTKFQ